MLIEIGNKQLKELSKEELIEIVMIEGCCASPEYWNDPVITDFNNTMFSDTLVINYVSYRKSDNIKSCEITFFFDFERFSHHYIRENEKGRNDYQPNSKRVGLKTLKYLIEKGYDIPLYSVINQVCVHPLAKQRKTEFYTECLDCGYKY